MNVKHNYFRPVLEQHNVTYRRKDAKNRLISTSNFSKCQTYHADGSFVLW